MCVGLTTCLNILVFQLIFLLFLTTFGQFPVNILVFRSTFPSVFNNCLTIPYYFPSSGGLKKVYKFMQTRSAATSQGGPGGGSPPVNSGGGLGGGAEAPPDVLPSGVSLLGGGVIRAQGQKRNCHVSPIFPYGFPLNRPLERIGPFTQQTQPTRTGAPPESHCPSAPDRRRGVRLPGRARGPGRGRTSASPPAAGDSANTFLDPVASRST